MTSETENLKLKLQSLTSAFSDLEDKLSPLFTQSLPEALVHLEPIQQAKLQTAVASAVHDLIFIYLKTKGIDPKTHPVISELDRIKQYFDKIENAENPSKRTTELDKATASRFIKHAISAAQLKDDRAKGSQLSWKKTRAEEAQESSSSSDDEETRLKEPNIGPQHKIPPKITSKMLARQQYENELRKQDANPDSDEDNLEVFDGIDQEFMNVDDQQGKGDKGKTNANSNPNPSSATMTHKRQRPVMDPFAASGFVGVGEDEQTLLSPLRKILKSSSHVPAPGQSLELSDKASKKDKKKKKEKKKKKKPNLQPSM